MSANLLTRSLAAESLHSQQLEYRDFRGAAIVDQSGREIPITSDMVNRALNRASDFLWPTLSTHSTRQNAS